MSLIIIKLGGSLMRSKELFYWLKNIFSNSKKNICIVVPGGGEFAENIRISQKQLNFSDEIAHKMAILAMSQYGYFLTEINKNINIVRNMNELKEIKGNIGSFLLLPDYSFESNIDLPKSWSFSSDSIALWLAIFMNADKLIMIKSKKVTFDKSKIDDHIKDNDIDKGFKILIKKYKGELIFLDKKQHNVLKEII